MRRGMKVYLTKGCSANPLQVHISKTRLQAGRGATFLPEIEPVHFT
jgi:hypothetical protein